MIRLFVTGCGCELKLHTMGTIMYLQQRHDEDRTYVQLLGFVIDAGFPRTDPTATGPPNLLENVIPRQREPCSQPGDRLFKERRALIPIFTVVSVVRTCPSCFSFFFCPPTTRSSPPSPPWSSSWRIPDKWCSPRPVDMDGHWLQNKAVHEIHPQIFQYFRQFVRKIGRFLGPLPSASTYLLDDPLREVPWRKSYNFDLRGSRFFCRSDKSLN